MLKIFVIHTSCSKFMQLTTTNVERSVSQQRLRSLAETLNQSSIQNKIHIQEHNQAIQKKMDDLTNRVETGIKTDEKKFHLLEDNIQKLKQAFHFDHELTRHMDQKRTKEVQLLYDAVQKQITGEIVTRQDNKQQMCSKVVEQQGALLKEMQRVSEERVRIDESQIDYMKEQITKVVTTLTEDRQKTDFMYNELNQLLDNQCFDIRNRILGESQEAQKQEEGFRETFQKVCQMLAQKLVDERRDREAKESQLLDILEKVCSSAETMQY